MQPDSQKVWVNALKEFLGLPTSALLAIVFWGVALGVCPALRSFPWWLALLAFSALAGPVTVRAWQKREKAKGYQRAFDSMSLAERGRLDAALVEGTSTFHAPQLDPGANSLAHKGFARMVGPTPDWDTFIWTIDPGLWEWLRQHASYIDRAV